MIDFSHIIGQSHAKLAMTDWYNFETQPLLIYGQSGFGKTMFAEAMGARTIDTTQFKGDKVNTILKPIKESEDGEILFFDEIHSLPGKVLEGLYKIIDKGTFFDAELCVDLPIPRVRFIFATNILNPLPDAFCNRCRFVELANYSEEELAQIVQLANPKLEPEAIVSIIKASKGVPRTALSLAKSIKAGAKTEGYYELNKDHVDNLLISRFLINPETGLSEKEFKIVQKVVERGRLSSSAVANLVGCTLKDARSLYIEPLRANEWVGVSNQGIIPGYRAHANYRVFLKREASK